MSEPTARQWFPGAARLLLVAAVVLTGLTDSMAQPIGGPPVPAGTTAPGHGNATAPPALSPSAQSFEGTLIVVWGDPHPDFGGPGEIRYTLALSDGSGTLLPLQLAGQENVAASYFNQPVVVSGRLAASPYSVSGAPGAEAIVVDTITPSRAPKAYSDIAAAVFGTRRVIYLLVKFSDDAAVPHVPTFYTNLNNPDTTPAGEVFPATVNSFFKKTSWNQFSWLGDVAGVGGVGAPGGWLTLPYPKSYYAPCGWSGACANLTALSNDATALGKAQGITFTNYDNINFVLSNDLDCCAWGGGYMLDGKSYGATWEPPWGQETGTYAHEMGHSIGLPHSGWVYAAYDSPWDMMSARMSATNVVCGSYLSKNAGGTFTLGCTEPGDGYIVAHKDYLGWIPAANAVVTDTVSSVTVTLEGGALPLGAAAKMIKICIAGLSCTGSAAHYFTVEARVKSLGAASQFDNGMSGEGVIIHDVQLDRSPISGSCFFNSQSGWAVPVDSTPGDYDSAACNAGGRSYPNYALLNAQFGPGQTYTNTTYGLGIAVLSRAASTFVVATYVRPTVTTNAASAVAATGATLNGAVSSNGASTTVTFQYGLTTSYGSTITAAQSPLPAGTSGAPVSAAATGLNCNTLYHLRAVGANSLGTTNGADATFTTAACPLVTSTAISAHTPNPSLVGAPIAVTAGVTATPPGAGTPTGTITVSDGSASCLITLPATGCNLTPTSAGAKTLTATYSGDASFNGSTAPGIGHAVNAVITGALDVDASVTATKYDALTDGLLVIRYLSGLTGSSLTTGALGGTATRTDPAAIETYLDDIHASLDIDGNGTADAQTDGLLILRYLFGLRGSALIAGAFDPLGTRTTAPDIEAYLQTLMP